jgi:hypothetical protein
MGIFHSIQHDDKRVISSTVLQDLLQVVIGLVRGDRNYALMRRHLGQSGQLFARFEA